MEVIMSDLKNGDIVELTTGLANSFYSGDRLKFVCSDGDNAILSHMIVVSKNKFKKVEGSKSDYETSNRKKLHDHIKASGYTSSELGEVMGRKWHFSNITKKSRFDKFGDIPDADLLHLIGLVDSCGYMVDASKLVSSRTKKESNDLSDHVETETDSEFQFVGGGYDPVFFFFLSKNPTHET